MSTHQNPYNIKIILAVIFFSCVSFCGLSYSQDSGQDANQGYITFADSYETSQAATPKGAAVKKENAALIPKKEVELTELQKEARGYREQGLHLQKMGNLAGAMTFYQKAVELDPAYAVALNDLGVVYESLGYIDKAEDSYIKAMKADPDYLSVYANLALLYESKRDLERASFFWKKRAELGSPDDPWTERAKQRLDDLAQISPGYRQMTKESETVLLMKQVAEAKSAKEKEDQKKAVQSFKNAKNFYLMHEYQEALDEINKAVSSDPQDKEKIALRDKIKKIVDEEQERVRQEAMLKEKKENTKRMREYFEYGVSDYQQGNLEAARIEFNKIIELTASPQKD